MKNKKMDFFMLQLSFIGWAILGSFTLGISYIYIYSMSYYMLSCMNFYEEIK